MAAALGISALAQNPPMISSNEPGKAESISDAQLKEALKFTDLKGLPVESRENEKLGKFRDLAVDLGSGRIAGVIVSTGGFMGVDSTLTVVPPVLLHHDAALNLLQLGADRAKFEAAPKIDATAWNRSLDTNQFLASYNYYGEPFSSATDRDRDSDATNQDGTTAGRPPRNIDGSINNSGERAVDAARNTDVGATNADAAVPSPNQMSTRGDLPSWSLGPIEKASELMGMTVTNGQGEEVGKVENLEVDLPFGRVVAVILSSGSFMGMGGEYSAVPPSAFRLNEESNALVLDVSKDALANSPHFTSGQWPDFSQPSYTSGIYRAYHVRPYFSLAADNTGRNVRDRNNQTATPPDQGNSQSDLDVTAQIRQAIMKDSTMSIYAQNCKIITKNGQVTLRGPVTSEDEKKRIADISNQAAQGRNVDNQLEIVSQTQN